MKLSDLFSPLNEAKLLPASAQGLEISGVAFDTRAVKSGSLFVAVRGGKNDGHQFIAQALQKGAIALVVEDLSAVPQDFKGPVLKVENSRSALDKLASQFFDNPSRDLFCFGVTGTNGKTSTTYMLEHVMNRLQIATGVMGTVNHHFLQQVWPTEMTTPDPVNLQMRLQQIKEAGARAVAMEVSSHALAQHRADGVQFNTVIFTNLTRDHLDYHKDMDDYFVSKQRLFTEILADSAKPATFAVVNIDDPWGARLRVSAQASLWTFAQKKSADFKFKILKMDFSRTDFELKTPVGVHRSYLPMCGAHNVYNAVGAIAAAATAGVVPLMSLSALQSFTGVPGRLETVPNKKNVHVFVDYAHSPDALENVLQALTSVRRDLKSQSRIWTVFGCGGDRDKGKRAEMAKIAARLSDKVMVTSDNPRTEDPALIIGDILAGFSTEECERKVKVEADRELAIGQVLRQVEEGDVVLIAGKGHEDYQIIGTEKRHFSDVEVAQRFLQGS